MDCNAFHDCFCSHSLDSIAKSNTRVRIVSVQSQTTLEQSAENVDHSYVTVAPETNHISKTVIDQGNDTGTVGAAIACQRCLESPCSCRVEGDAVEPDDGMDAVKKPAEPSVAPSPKGPPVCTVCGKKLQDRKKLKQHMNTHTDGPVQCGVCGRTFARAVNLTYHMKSHSIDRPFCCDQCGERFAVKGFLDKHMTVHQTESEKEAAKKMAEANQMLHCCRKCGESFPAKWRLQVGWFVLNCALNTKKISLFT